jgi:hypothetical protein
MAKGKANIGNYETITGVKGNVFNPKDWLRLILGAMVTIVVIATGQKFLTKAGNLPVIDTQIEKPYRDPMPVRSSRAVL